MTHKLSTTPLGNTYLPGNTINDYMLANVNGLRFVLPDLNGIEWSASVFASSRSSAFYFHSYHGVVSTNTRSNVYPTRCVGR